MATDLKQHNDITFIHYQTLQNESKKICFSDVHVFQKNLLSNSVLQGGIKCANLRTGFIDSEDPKHTLFCRETAFVAIYALFQG